MDNEKLFTVSLDSWINYGEQITIHGQLILLYVKNWIV